LRLTVFRLCEKHHFDLVKAMLQREMRRIYKTVDTAFSQMDFSGQGKIREEDFFKTLVKYKLPFSQSVRRNRKC